MARTILEIAQSAAERDVTAPAPSALFGTNDRIARALRSAAYDTMREYLVVSNWVGLSEFQSTWVFALRPGVFAYPLPPDFNRIIPNTEQRNGWPLGLVGPTSPQSWAAWLYGQAAVSAPMGWRIRNNSIVIEPTPQAEELVVIEYITRYPVVSPVKSGDYDFSTTPPSTIDPVVPRDGQSYIESGPEQAIREALEPASVNLTNRVISDNVYNLPDAARVQDRGDVANSIFNRSFSLMAPEIERSNDRLLTNLQGRGIPVGSEAFNDAYGDQTRNVNDTISRLAMDADIAAGQEQSRAFGLDQAERSSAMSEIVAAMGGGYNPPNSSPSGAAASVPISQMINQSYQNDLNAYNANQKQRMAGASAIGSLGGALIKSARDTKTVFGQVNTDECAKAVSQIDLYSWTYNHNHEPTGVSGVPHIGPMADDFKRATGLGDDQFIPAVDYFGVLMGALQNALERIKMLETLARDQGDLPEKDGLVN